MTSAFDVWLREPARTTDGGDEVSCSVKVCLTRPDNVWVPAQAAPRGSGKAAVGGRGTREATGPSRRPQRPLRCERQLGGADCARRSPGTLPGRPTGPRSTEISTKAKTAPSLPTPPSLPHPAGGRPFPFLRPGRLPLAPRTGPSGLVPLPAALPFAQDSRCVLIPPNPPQYKIQNFEPSPRNVYMYVHIGNALRNQNVRRFPNVCKRKSKRMRKTDRRTR